MKKSYSSYRTWGNTCPTLEKGVIVASDQTLEWLLEWWWDHYAKENDLPVFFVDFGMTPEAKSWCKDHGELFELPMENIIDEEDVPAELIKIWKADGENYQARRNSWFKKPLACLQTPFKRSIWIDLDCKVLGSLAQLFELQKPSMGIAIARDQNFPPSEVSYNSGVILFDHGIKIFEEWAEQCLDSNNIYFGDQDVLTKLIHDRNLQFELLSNLYNWSYLHPKQEGVKIHHFHGMKGKDEILSEITQQTLGQWLF